MLTSYISNARLSFCSQLSQKKENFVQQGPKCRPHVDILCIILGAPQTVMQCQVVPKYTLLNHLSCTAPATVDHVCVQPQVKLIATVSCKTIQHRGTTGDSHWAQWDYSPATTLEENIFTVHAALLSNTRPLLEILVNDKCNCAFGAQLQRHMNTK